MIFRVSVPATICFSVVADSEEAAIERAREIIPKGRITMDYPVTEILERANAALIALAGAEVFFNFTCAACGARQTFETPYTLHTSGTCEECGAVTQITKAGFDLVMKL